MIHVSDQYILDLWASWFLHQWVYLAILSQSGPSKAYILQYKSKNVSLSLVYDVIFYYVHSIIFVIYFYVFAYL